MKLKSTRINKICSAWFRSYRFVFFPVAGTVFLICLFILLGFSSPKTEVKPVQEEKWVGTWSTAPQLVEPHNMPPNPGLSNNTLRQVVCVSIGGDYLRVRFSNEFSTSPVTLEKVQVAISEGNGTIDESSTTELSFNGEAAVTMAPGEAINSDPFAFSLRPRMELAITIAFGETSPDVTGHPGSRTTSYLLSVNQFTDTVKTDHWYIINGIDVKASESAAAVAIIGNSITDGRGSGTNKQNRWPDILAQRLLENNETNQVAVLNM